VVTNFYIISTTILAVFAVGHLLYFRRTLAKAGPSYMAGNILLWLGALIVACGFGLAAPKVNYRIIFAGLCVFLTAACLVFWGMRKEIGLSSAVGMWCVMIALFALLTWGTWDVL
jgi:hypothetical protein